jgi:hypothetical protein
MTRSAPPKANEKPARGEDVAQAESWLASFSREQMKIAMVRVLSQLTGNPLFERSGRVVRVEPAPASGLAGGTPGGGTGCQFAVRARRVTDTPIMVDTGLPL